APQFQQKVMESQVVEETVEVGCKVCKKVGHGGTYSSRGALESHVKSKKHLEMVKKLGDKVEGSILFDDSTSGAASSYAASSQTTESDSDASIADPSKESFRVRLGKATTEREIDAILQEKMEQSTRLTPLDCLFCRHVSPTIDETLVHMASSHSFFIPDIEFLVDVEGLLQYLGDKIAVANVCIFCNGKGRAMHSTEAVRAHMVSKSHCKIPYEDGDEDEIAEFYEFGQGEDDGWEDEAGDEGDDEGDEDNEEYSDDEGSQANGVVFTDHELILPSGVRIGHRAFRRYWKQHLRPVQIVPGSMMDPAMGMRLEGQYKQLGYKQPGTQLVGLGNAGQGVLTKLQRLEIKVQKREARRALAREQDYRARVGQKHNMLQHHYREQNPF
ncbi:hypothetical protein HDV03_004125, partial [Kappamyces sp. JEL0829]